MQSFGKATAASTKKGAAFAAPFDSSFLDSYLTTL